MNKKLISLLVIVLFMSIGFAAVVISLSFAGTATLAFDEADFNIFISKVSDGENLLNTISDDNDSFTFTSDGTSMATYYVINRSIKYNAIINMSCDKSATINQESEVILAGTVVSGTVSSSYVGDITCTLNSLPTPREQDNDNDANLISLDGEGASLDVSEFYVVKDFPVGALPLPKIAGKTLLGWFTSTEEDATQITSSTVVDFTDNTTLYAKWVDDVELSEPGETEIVLPHNGKYLLQAWGAQGGTLSSVQGGVGGYSIGTYDAVAGTKLYLVVGGQGSTSGVGGYNGGGTGNESYTGGGGASHIALEPGLLKDVASNKVLIVAGGGGGSGSNNSSTVSRSGSASWEASYNVAGTSYSCPNGGTLSGTTCSKTETTAANSRRECSQWTGQICDDTHCWYPECPGYVTRYSCPSGYTSSGSGASMTCTKATTYTATSTPSVNTTSTSGTASASSRLGTRVHSFTANTSGTVTFRSTSNTRDPYCTIYINGSSATTNDDGGDGNNYLCSTSYSSGDTVELYSGLYSSSDTITYATAQGGVGGGTNGSEATGSSRGTQTSGASFGTGGSSTTGSGGGGGYYGGTGNNNIGGGAGGSGYVSTLLASSRTYAGDSTFLSPAGTNETGHTGNGYIRVTCVPYTN